jgi:hypothetical protein
MEQNTTEQEAINYLVMALALSGVSVNTYTADLIIETWKGICKKGGQFSISDACNIEFKIRNKHKSKTIVTAKENEPSE